MPRELSIARPVSVNRPVVTDDKASLNFVAGTDKVDCGADFIGVGDVTVVAIIKPRSMSGVILGNGKFKLGISITNSGSAYVKSDGSTTKFSGIGSLTANKWQFVAATRTAAGIVNFRIRGVASGTANQNAGAPAAGTTNAVMGNDAAGGNRLIAKIKKVIAFNRILSAAEIDNIMYNGNIPSGVIANYKIDEGTGSTTSDSSGNGHTGTLVGAAWSSDTPSMARTLSVDRPLSI